MAQVIIESAEALVKVTVGPSKDVLTITLTMTDEQAAEVAAFVKTYGVEETLRIKLKVV